MRMGWKIFKGYDATKPHEQRNYYYCSKIGENSVNYHTRSQARSFIKRWVETYNVKHGITPFVRVKQFNPIITVRHIDGSITRVAA